ncbi:hypothetical protein FVEN_g6527 [Fusarium venenatum]|nr:hypothetical protein FVEN_g6527 [Fusarium venenatum]
MSLRANAHKATIKELEQSLERCRKVMETELLFKICDQSTAIEKQQSQAFSQLERDVQDLIRNLASGQTKIENLVAEQTQKTRKVLSTNIAAHFKASEAKAITDAQRERLLKSLKPAEIRMRYNDVMSPSDASFERVFASYERVCRKDSDHKDWRKIKRGFLIGIQEETENDVEDSNDSNNTDEHDESDESEDSDDSDDCDYVDVGNIDCIWESFGAWLQSDDPLFWIQGKPGSGKSTLMKFIIENDNTACLLESWNSEMRILSYFFWKIGQQSQNSIKGLLCCLLHDLLDGDYEMLDKVLEHFSFSRSKDFYQEWSSEEAEKVLYFLLQSQTCPTCIFIDGLDEISDKDGFQVLIRVLWRIWEMPMVKICVSSRLETGLVKRLEGKKAQKLQRPMEFSFGFFLATHSIITGIENGDDEESLMKRLDELPDELEALYEAMWSKLNANNRIYRETAAMYFHCMIADGWSFRGTDAYERSRMYRETPTLAQLSMVVKFKDDQMFPPRVNNKSLHELKQLCDATESDLSTRCAGLLQISEKSVFDTSHRKDAFTSEIYPFTRSVQFIHRTAHDFLVDTKPEQDILNYYSGMNRMVDLQLKMFKSELYLSAVYHTIGVTAMPDDAIEHCVELQKQGVNDKAMLPVLQVIQNLWDQDLCLSWMLQSGSSQAPTVALRDICIEWNSAEMASPPTQMIQRLIASDADPHAVGLTSPSLRPPFDDDACFTHEISAYELLLRGALNRFSRGDYDVLPTILKVIDSMAPSCPEYWRRRIIVNIFHGELDSNEYRHICSWEYLYPTQGWATFEVDMQYLLNRLLIAVSSCGIPTQAYKVHEIANSAVESYSRIRNIVPRHTYGDKNLFCCRVINQVPWEGLCNNMFGPIDRTELSVRDLLERSFDENPEYDFLLGSYEQVSIDDEIDQLASEGLGFYREVSQEDYGPIE